MPLDQQARYVLTVSKKAIDNFAGRITPVPLPPFFVTGYLPYFLLFTFLWMTRGTGKVPIVSNLKTLKCSNQWIYSLVPDYNGEL